MSNYHSNCENYNSKKDYCLKFFEENVSENYKVCKEYSEFSDKELSTWHDTITDLELSIGWINRRIVFLKELIRVKRVMMEVKERI